MSQRSQYVRDMQNEKVNFNCLTGFFLLKKQHCRQNIPGVQGFPSLTQYWYGSTMLIACIKIVSCRNV